MKSLVTIITAMFIITLLSCGSAPSGNTNNKSTSTPTSSATTDDDASFSCILDRKEFSGKGTDQNINAAFRLKGDDKGQIFFRLSDMNNIGDKLNFQVPAKTGPTTFNVTPIYGYGGYSTSDFANYIDDPITVTITSISSARVAGTFSGKYTLQKGTGNNNSKQTIEVTDGKFDIPFSTSAQWKQMYHAE